MPHVPTHPKIYHIVHLDKLPSIVADAYVWCDRDGGSSLDRDDDRDECHQGASTRARRSAATPAFVSGSVYHSTSARDRSCST